MKSAWGGFIAALSSNLGLRIFSLIFALGLWLFVNVGQKPGEWPFQVPVEIRNVPAGVMVSSPGVEQVEVRLMGPPAVLSTVDPASLKVALDLEGARPGTSSFRLGPESFNPPRGTRVTRVSPSLINLKLDSVAARFLPVTVRLTGKAPAGYKVTRVEVSPSTVRVQGPNYEVNRMNSVDTVAVELESKGGQFKREARLSADGRLLSFSPDRVTVLVTLEEEQATREFSRVELKAKDFSGRYTVNPGSVYLRLAGPRRVLDQLEVGPEQAYLELKDLGPGSHSVPLSLKLPAEIKVLEQKPDRFRVRISTPPARAAGERS